MFRTFVATLDDREVSIEIEDSGASVFRVRIAGEEQVFDARKLGSNRLSLLLDGRNYEASVVRAGDQFDVLVGSHRLAFRLLSEERARRVAARGDDDVHGRREIKASMPGKVVEVLVKLGDAVEPKQGVLVIEAMKMENEIKTPGSGEVKEIRVEPGQAVESGEVLVVIE